MVASVELVPFGLPWRVRAIRTWAADDRGRRLSEPERTDNDLVARAATGDQAAFTALVARHRPRLVALAARVLGSRAAADDVVQDVFIRAWTHAPAWQARDPRRAGYAAWLSRVAVNLAIDQTRKAKAVPLDEAPEVPDAAPLAESALIVRERDATIRAAVAALPERQRAALALTYDAGLSNAEGAAALEISVGAFELLLVRARRALRQSLREE